MVTYLVAVNIISFIIMGYDKKMASVGGRRIPERTLLTLSLVGGALGIYTGMRKFRHKTRKTIFSAGVPLLVLLQAVLLFYIEEITRLF